MKPIGTVTDHVIHIARAFGYTVEIHRDDGMFLIHGQILGAPVNLAGPRVDDFDVGIMFETGLDNGQMTGGVNLQINLRRFHAVYQET